MAASAVVFAYHDVGARCLGVLVEAGVDVRLVVTHEDDPGENVFFASVAGLARARGIEVATPADANEPAFVERVARLSPDFLFSFYYRRMLSPALLATARRGAYNMHGSLLPKYRGRVPVNWAVINGETETGATLHYMTEKPDAGASSGRSACRSAGRPAGEVFRVTTRPSRARRGLRASSTPRSSAQDLSKGATSAAAPTTAASTGPRARPRSTTRARRGPYPPFPAACSAIRLSCAGIYAHAQTPPQACPTVAPHCSAASSRVVPAGTSTATSRPRPHCSNP
jgi:methionyl-tRNA formyltransferase